MTFTKLFSSITESTIWGEEANIRLVWITMLAMADRLGRVYASVPGLAHRARVPLEDAEEALKKFLAPDPYSRTTDNEGRRIAVIDGGWKLLNHAKYRAIRDEEAILEAKRKYINTKRAKQRIVNGVARVDRSRHNAEAEAEAIVPPSGVKGVSAKAFILKQQKAAIKEELATFTKPVPKEDVPRFRELKAQYVQTNLALIALKP